MNEHLHVRSQAPDRPARNAARSGEALGRVDPLPSVAHLVDATTFSVERDGVDVDLAPTPIDQYEAHRRSAVDQLVAKLVEHIDDPLRMLQLGDEIEIVVLASLALEKRVHTPAAVQPHVDPVLLEPVDDLDEAAVRPLERSAHARDRPAYMLDIP